MNKTELIAAVAEASGKSKLLKQVMKSLSLVSELSSLLSAKLVPAAILPPEQRSRFPLLFSRNSLPANSLKMPSIQNNLFLS